MAKSHRDGDALRASRASYTKPIKGKSAVGVFKKPKGRKIQVPGPATSSSSAAPQDMEMQDVEMQMRDEVDMSDTDMQGEYMFSPAN